MTPGAGEDFVRDAKSATHADLVWRLASQPALARAVVPQLGPVVDGSWRRCLHEFNLDPARDYQPTVLDITRVKDLQAEHEELVHIARAEMDSLYEQISGSGYALLLADTDGVILCEKVDPQLKRMFSRAGLIVGAQWSEQREGTNGIGTCASEARPITIHQSDHFRSRHVGLSCSAAPIHDSSGRVIAVLDASCVNANGARESQMHTVALVATSARLIEKCLFLRRHRANAILRFHHRAEFVDLLHDGAIALAADGTILAGDATSLKLLGAADRRELVGRSIADVFDTSYAEMRASTLSGRRAMWEVRDHQFGRRYFASMADVDERPRPAPPSSVVTRTVVSVVAGACAGAGAMSLEELAGEDPQMLRSARNALRVAPSRVAVIILGPTGSGKELFAKAMHLAAGVRARGEFVAINCAAIPESLIESELFGYCAGAFTGARRQGMRGRIAQSSGGTLFLDEIGDMPLSMQTRLLRVLEEQEVLPLGADRAVKVDLRVLCASHRNLRDMVARGDFREDLYYRLNGITFELPALATRQDKEALVRRCIEREAAGAEPASIEFAALQRLLAYEWPGNIRQLRNAIRTALAIAAGRTIRLADLPDEVRECQAALPAAVPASLGDAEKTVLIRTIEQHGSNMSRVAAHLGISRNTLYRKIKRHGIVISRRCEF